MHKTTKPKGIGPKIKELKLLEPNLTYREIGIRLDCANSTVCYHLNSFSRLNTLKLSKINENKHPYIAKTKRFKYKKKVCPPKQIGKLKTIKSVINNRIINFTSIGIGKGKFMKQKPDFTFKDVINKFSENPICALTGEQLDIYDTSSYQFDHKIPRSRGGDNSIDNLQLVTKRANLAKGNMTQDELLHLCKRILEHSGFEVNKLVALSELESEIQG